MGMAPPLSGDSASSPRTLVSQLHPPGDMSGRRWENGGGAGAPVMVGPRDAPIAGEQGGDEPKYDGRGALVAVEPGAGRHGVHIWSRRGRDETARYPEIVRVLATLARQLRAAVVLDGAIVAVDAGRSTFIAFDVLRDGDEDLRRLPLT